ncbi:uncharacterized protein LOC106708788 [Papilio machaon]|uniref:uncharacterized protein LOC106708788 n=1 Tax=Papilio machaon TaxID=76193 RepID=UPI001E665E39|nr:uncharacterized protein LOC106708788 [Papilio machaon]
MFTLASLFIIGTVFQITTSQGPPPLPPNLPPECLNPPHIENPRKCCQIPPIFTKDEFENCGFKEENVDKPRHGPPDCSKQLCLLKSRNLVKDGDKVDHEAMISFMDKWVEANQDFKPTVESAKTKCLAQEIPGPMEICEANKIVFCISSVLFTECPKWVTGDDDCKKLRDHIDTCSKYFS